MKVELQNDTSNKLNSSYNFPPNSSQLHNSPNCICISTLCIMTFIYNVCSILRWIGIMPAVSEGPLLLAANFQGSGFNSFTFFYTLQKSILWNVSIILNQLQESYQDVRGSWNSCIAWSISCACSWGFPNSTSTWGSEIMLLKIMLLD